MMASAVLGIDTSNYRTSVAVVTLAKKIIFNHRELLPVPAGERGLRQNEAVFAHIRSLARIEDALREAVKDCRIVAVCVSTRPRDAEDSYMPVFEVGRGLAAMLGAALHAPVYTTTHQRGHLEAALEGTALDRSQPWIGLHLSGGTTEMLKINGETPEIIGGSLDLHAGQLVDRAGVAMGLGFPSGPALEKLARQGSAEGRLGASLEQGDRYCHFSGAETTVQRWIQQRTLPETDIAREIYDLLARTISRMIRAGCRETGAGQALLAGGIAASALEREMLTDRIRKSGGGIRLFFGEEALCGDNAVGTALIGIRRYMDEQARGIR